MEMCEGIYLEVLRAGCVDGWVLEDGARRDRENDKCSN